MKIAVEGGMGLRIAACAVLVSNRAGAAHKSGMLFHLAMGEWLECMISPGTSLMVI
jgi:hypothetical protein